MWGTSTSTATVSTISQAPFKPNTYHHRRCPMLATTAARLPCSAVFFCSVACCRRKSNVEIHQCLCWRCLERITRTKKHKQTPSMKQVVRLQPIMCVNKNSLACTISIKAFKQHGQHHSGDFRGQFIGHGRCCWLGGAAFSASLLLFSIVFFLPLSLFPF